VAEEEVMAERKRRAAPVKTPSAYTRGDVEVNRLRSGDGVNCGKCGARIGTGCTGARNRALLYNHAERRDAGKRAADALIIARNRTAT
jgi:hypothetical protein